MSTLTLALILLSSIGFLLSGLFSAYLLFLKKNRSQLQLLLGALLLALSLRIGKSVFHNFTELPVVIKNLGLAANLAIGPILWCYAKVLLQQQTLPRSLWWHFLPAAAYVVLSPFLPNQTGDSLWLISYSLVIFQQFCYLGASASLVRDWQASWNNGPQKGFVILWAGISLIWLTYLLIFVQLLPVYLFGALAYSVLVILLVYFAVKEEYRLSHREKYGPDRLSARESQRYLTLLREKIEQDKSYLDPDLTIQAIAEEVDLPAKVISQVINEQLKLNFSAFINAYRIEEAKERLSAADYQQFTIASIAYDCGFNSISSFNTTFKAMTRQTPSQFRRAYAD